MASHPSALAGGRGLSQPTSKSRLEADFSSCLQTSSARSTATPVFEVARSRIRQNSGRCGGRRPARDRPNSWEFGYFRSKCATSKTPVPRNLVETQIEKPGSRRLSKMAPATHSGVSAEADNQESAGATCEPIIGWDCRDFNAASTFRGCEKMGLAPSYIAPQKTLEYRCLRGACPNFFTASPRDDRRQALDSHWFAFLKSNRQSGSCGTGAPTCSTECVNR